jgi:hypothetical protein
VEQLITCMEHFIYSLVHGIHGKVLFGPKINLASLMISVAKNWNFLRTFDTGLLYRNLRYVSNILGTDIGACAEITCTRDVLVIMLRCSIVARHVLFLCYSPSYMQTCVNILTFKFLKL